MDNQLKRLPDDFPDGTRFVIEGRNGRIHSQYLEFPDGRHIDLPTDLANRMSARALPRRRRRRKPVPQKIFNRSGTAKRAAR